MDACFIKLSQTNHFIGKESDVLVRLTGLCGANAFGEKLPLFVIGKSAKPRCFKNVKNLPMQELHDWGTISRVAIRSGQTNGEGCRNICMIVDNCPAHPNVDGLKATELRIFPPNTTSKTQPMDQCVIRSTKAKYRSSLIFKMLRAVDSGLDIPSESMIDAMVMLNNAWNDVTPETIVNCFRKAGLSSYSQEQAVRDLDDPFQQDSEDLESCILRLRQEAPHLVPIGVDATSIVEADDDCVHTGNTSQINKSSLKLVAINMLTMIPIKRKTKMM